MSKKSWGIILIILGCVCMLNIPINGLEVLRQIKILFDSSVDSGDRGFAFGYMLPSLFFTTSGIVLIVVGIKWMNLPKPRNQYDQNDQA